MKGGDFIKKLTLREEIEDLESRLAVDNPHFTYKQKKVSYAGRQFKYSMRTNTGKCDPPANEIPELLKAGVIIEVGI